MEDEANDAERTRPPLMGDLVGLCRELNQRNVNYIVVGGMAINIHGFTRNTEEQKVKDMKTLISNKRFLISITDVSDPNRAMYIEEFKTMNTNLSVLMSEAATAEDVIINKNEQEVLEKNQMHYNFIDLTIAAVVADKHDADWGRQTTPKKGKHHHEKNCLPTTAATAAASLEVTTFI